MKSRQHSIPVLTVLTLLLVAVSAHGNALISTVTPDQNELGVQVSNIVTVTFTTDMNAGTINSSSFTVRSREGGPVQGTVFYISSIDVAYFVPSNYFEEGEHIIVNLTSAIETSGGAPLTGGFSWSFETETCAYGDFDPTSEYDTKPDPYDVVVADLNGDGHLDAATACLSADYISVLLNDGNGEFPNHTDYFVGTNSGPDEIHAADLDGDGDVDLVTPNYEGSTVTIFKNDGYGGFSYHYDFQVKWNPYAAFPADLDGDGDMDLVTAHPTLSGQPDSIGVLFNNGNATFAAVIKYEVLQRPYDTWADDLNNDGFIDIVTANYWSSAVSVLLNDGTGQFPTRSDYSVGSRPSGIIAADLDGDGDLDIVTPNWLSDNVSVLMNDGTGSFGSHSTYAVGNEPSSAFAADLDGDGDLDLAVTENEYDNNVSVLWNNGNGTFGSCEAVASGHAPRDVFAADIDGEGSVDLVVANKVYEGSIGIIRNFGPPPAPELFAPVNGKELPAPATPTLRCYEVPTGLYYHFVIDDDADCGSPIAQSGLIYPYTEWMVPVELGVGTYYWRARGINACGAGEWSDIWHIVVVSGPGPSCPVLYSYNGDRFVEENPLLTACERSGYVDVVTDYYHLRNPVAPRAGQLVFQLRELEDEITFLNVLELIAVDHDPHTTIGCSSDGHVFCYDEIVAPVSATDHTGRNCLDVLASVDGHMYVSEGPGSLTITFPYVCDLAGFGFFAPKKTPCPHNPKTVPYVEQEAAVLLVELLQDDGSWTTLPDVPSRENAVEEIVLTGIPRGLDSDEIVIRISWEDGFSTDVIRQYVPSDDPPDIADLSMTDCILMPQFQGRASSIRLDIGDQAILSKGDVLEVSFDVSRQVEPGLQRDYIVKAVGRYEPDYSVYEHLLPSRAKLFSNFPNPFNPSTTIAFDLPVSMNVELEVLNLLGQCVVVLVDGVRDAGHHAVEWNGLDSHGNPVSSGVYFYRLKTDGFMETRKMMLLK